MSSVISWSNYFGIGFTTLNLKFFAFNIMQASVYIKTRVQLGQSFRAHNQKPTKLPLFVGGKQKCASFPQQNVTKVRGGKPNKLLHGDE